MATGKIKDQAVGALFALAVGLLLYWITSSPGNSPSLLAKISTGEVFFPVRHQGLPSETDLRRFDKALAEIKAKEPWLYADLTGLKLSDDAYSTLRILESARCIFQFEISNNSRSKASNINILAPNIVGGALDNNPLRQVNENKLIVGDLLPNEIRKVIVVTRLSCPSNFRKINNEEVFVAFDGGSADLDFFSNQSGLLKFVNRHEQLITTLGFMLFIPSIFLVLMFLFSLFSRKPNSGKKPAR